MNLSRRGFLSGIIALGVAPAIVRVASIMPVKVMPRHDDLIALLDSRMRAAEEVLLRNMEENLFSQGSSFPGLAALVRDTGDDVVVGGIDRRPIYTWRQYGVPVHISDFVAAA